MKDISKKVKPPPYDYNTRKERRKRAHHGKVNNLNKGNCAKVFEDHYISDEDRVHDTEFRSSMKFHPEDKESGAEKLERIRHMGDVLGDATPQREEEVSDEQIEATLPADDDVDETISTSEMSFSERVISEY